MSNKLKERNNRGMKKKEGHEEKINLFAMWKQFWNPDPEELTEEEVILQDETLSLEDKKELIKALKDRDKMVDTIFKNSYKKTDLKVEARECAQKVLPQNPIHIEAKTGEITRGKEKEERTR